MTLGARTYDTPPIDVAVSRPAPGFAVVAVDGDIDIATADVVRAAVNGELEAQPRHLVIDLTGTSFMDSTGLGIIAGARAGAAAWDGELTVVTPSARLHKHFALTGLDRYIRIVPDLERALRVSAQ